MIWKCSAIFLLLLFIFVVKSSNKRKRGETEDKLDPLIEKIMIIQEKYQTASYSKQELRDAALAIIYADDIQYAVRVSGPGESDTFTTTVTLRGSSLNDLPTSEKNESGELVLKTTQNLFHQFVIDDTPQELSPVIDLSHVPTRHFRFIIEPAVVDLELSFNQTSPLHVAFEYPTLLPSPILDSIQISHFRSFPTINAAAIGFVRTFSITAQDQAKTYTTLTLPMRVDVFKLLREFEYAPIMGTTIYSQTISQKVELFGVTLKEFDLSHSFSGNALLFQCVHFLSKAAIMWPINRVEYIIFQYGSWPKEGIDLSVIPEVRTLEFRNLTNYFPVSLQSFVFPASVTTLIFNSGSYKLLERFNSDTFTSTITEIRVIMKKNATIHENCLHNLCKAIIQENVTDAILKQCSKKIRDIPTIWIQESDTETETEWKIINVPEVKEFLSNDYNEE